MKTGTYTGDGTADRVIDIGFTPKGIWIYPTQNAAGPPPSNLVSAAAAIASDFSSCYFGTSLWTHNPAYFQGIVPDGFKTGTTAVTGEGTNVSGVPYFWIAF